MQPMQNTIRKILCRNKSSFVLMCICLLNTTLAPKPYTAVYTGCLDLDLPYDIPIHLILLFTFNVFPIIIGLRNWEYTNTIHETLHRRQPSPKWNLFVFRILKLRLFCFWLLSVCVCDLIFVYKLENYLHMQAISEKLIIIIMMTKKKISKSYKMQSEPMKVDYFTKSNFRMYIRLHRATQYTSCAHRTFQFSAQLAAIFNPPPKIRISKKIDIIMNEIINAIHDIRFQFCKIYALYARIKTFPPNIPK